MPDTEVAVENLKVAISFSDLLRAQILTSLKNPSIFLDPSRADPKEVFKSEFYWMKDIPYVEDEFSAFEVWLNNISLIPDALEITAKWIH